jgi:hypothetical protein
MLSEGYGEYVGITFARSAGISLLDCMASHFRRQLIISTFTSMRTSDLSYCHDLCVTVDGVRIAESIY